MKKVLLFVLAAMMVLSCVACGEPKEDINAKSEGVMTYAQYSEAALESQVVIEAYVQAKQVYSEQYGNTSIYAQDGEGAYFIYRLPCTKEQYDSIAIGSKIKVTGVKAEWSGEVEITDATFEVVEGKYIAEKLDVTALLASEDLIKHQNKAVAIKGATVAASKDSAGNDVAFLYNWDGSGQEGNDLYFNVTVDGKTYNFCVESDLCGADTDVYKAVKALKIGDKIDLEGFLYWYNGANPHITAVTPAK
ncbi:MAG: hypothetical protein IJF74_02800 [Clostridia bacterium]|nr:hypothetical protein [Clostridia bacterium]